MSDAGGGFNPHEPRAAILVVDDNEANLSMLARRLRRRGFEVDEAIDGPSAIAAARQRVYDIVLMDMSLPGMDGWEATRALKADPSTAVSRVIALTANVLAQHRDMAFEAGCDGFETKPVQFDRLLATICQLLETRS